jgi:hypothetical protein
MTGMMEACRSRQYSLTKTQKVRAPIGWPLMPWCDHQKGVGRHLAMWRLSDRVCGPRVRRSLTDGKELRCPASEKRWQAWWTGYEIGGWRDGTSLTSPASLAWAHGSLASTIVLALVPSYLCTSPQFPSEFLSFPPDSLVFLEPFLFFSFSFGLQYPYSYLSMAIAARSGFSAGTRNGFGEQSPTERSETFLTRANWEFSGICARLTYRLPCPCYFDSHATLHRDLDPTERRSSFPSPTPL